MKNTNNLSIKVIGLWLGTLLFLPACNNRNAEKNIQSETQTPSGNQDDKNIVQTKEILDAYLKIKNALVATNGKEAREAAEEMITTLTDVQSNLTKSLMEDAKIIASTEDVDQQRAHFHTLSDNLYQLIKLSGDSQVTLYRQFCPMARENEGAYWLSIDQEILNPYFGDQMLHCGSIKETL